MCSASPSAWRAAEKAVIDYGFHLIVANPDGDTLARDLPEAIETGIRSFKSFMTYDRMRLHDEQILDVLMTARSHGALVMVHAENHDIIQWIAQRLLARGRKAPRVCLYGSLPVPCPPGGIDVA